MFDSSAARLALVLVLVSSISASAASRWDEDGVFVGPGIVVQTSGAHVVPDGEDGCIVVWGAQSLEVRAQRFDRDGNPLWALEGVLVGTGASYYATDVVSDQQGGVIVTWARSGANGGVLVQRLDPNGEAVWDAGGVLFGQSPNGSSFYGNLAADGIGGTWITWSEPVGVGNEPVVFLDRVLPSGEFSYDGSYRVSPASGPQSPRGLTLVDGDPVVHWIEQSFGGFDPYVNRYDFFLNRQWGTFGTNVSTLSAGSARESVLASDGVGGVLVVYVQDAGFGSQAGLQVQRVGGDGSLLYGSNRQLEASGNGPYDPRVVGDGAGGAIVGWLRGQPTPEVRFDRVLPSGFPYWGPTAVPQGSIAGDAVAMVSDGADGVVHAVSQSAGEPDYDVGVRRIANQGSFLWGESSPVGIDDASYSTRAIDMCRDGDSVWVVFARSATGMNVPALQRFDLDTGTWGRPRPLLDSVVDVPEDQGGHVFVNWRASGRDRVSDPLVTSYSVWRATEALPRGARIVTDDEAWSIDDAPAFRQSAGFYWEHVADQMAQGLEAYGTVAPTTRDSTAGDPATMVFQVIAHTADPGLRFVSDVASGASTDDIAPPAPLALDASREANGASVTWSSVEADDLLVYRVYRAMGPTVEVGPATLWTTTSDTTLVDPSGISGAWAYAITAVDAHENESEASDTLVLGNATSVGDVVADHDGNLRFLGLAPNPFSGRTVIDFALDRARPVRIDVFDLRGRRVRTLADEVFPSGRHSVVWDGRDHRRQSVANGAYWMRVTTPDVARAWRVMSVR